MKRDDYDDEEEFEPNIYNIAREEYIDISNKVIEAMCDDGWLAKRFK